MEAMAAQDEGHLPGHQPRPVNNMQELEEANEASMQRAITWVLGFGRKLPHGRPSHAAPLPWEHTT